MEDVGGRWVVYDDDFTELSAQPAEVFDVVSSVENTGFPEEPGTEHPPLVQQVCHRVSVLSRQTEKHVGLQQSRHHLWLPFYWYNVEQTLAKLAVNRTHSKSSPIFWRNSSTWGLFSTYTWNKHHKDKDTFKHRGIAGYQLQIVPRPGVNMSA